MEPPPEGPPVASNEQQERDAELVKEIPFHTYDDYQVLMRTVYALEAQERQAKQDLETLKGMHRDALADPAAFVQRLVSEPLIQFPERQRIVALPDIDVRWDSYSGTDAETRHFANSGHKGIGWWDADSASHKFIFGLGNAIPEREAAAVALARAPPAAVTTPSVSVKTAASHASRERDLGADEANPLKPSTFNQLWTPEEHARLVELLDVYPDEEVAAQRWEKISKALGTRTPKQVASRVQKYFIKLAKANLPVPGRMPNTVTYDKAAGGKKRQRNDEKPAAPKVFMSDEDNDSDSDSSKVDEATRNSEEYKELRRLRKLRKKKAREQVVQTSQHHGYRCDGCNMEPIVGTRWTCEDVVCATDGVDLCDACHQNNWENGLHVASHKMSSHARAEPEAAFYMDTDYASFGGEYNYLDPNFQPGLAPG